MNVDDLHFDDRGLVPAIVQDARSGEILMHAWMNAEALQLTTSTGLVHFWSRSRGELWQKGEQSGNSMHVVDLVTDCDADTLVVTVRPAGPACHTGSRTCFVSPESPTPAGMFGLEALVTTIADRAATRPEGSYTTSLIEGGSAATGRKVLEEAAEVVMAIQALERSDDSITHVAEEAADLLYHLLVALAAAGVDAGSMVDTLLDRAHARPAQPAAGH